VLTENALTRSVFCPLCGGDTSRAFQKHGYWLRDCAGCGHRFLEIGASDHAAHAAVTYGDEYFFGGCYPDYLAEGAILRAHGARYGKLMARYRKPGTVLDVGAAGGFILAGLQEAGWRGTGVEPNATMAGYARSNLRLDVMQGTIEGIAAAGPFDAVTMIQVLGHFLDPLAALRSAFRLTRQGGMLLVETRLRDSLTARVFGTSWHEYNPPIVLHWFTAESIAHLAGTCGYQFIARGQPRKRVTGAHAKTALRDAMRGGVLSKIVGRIVNVLPDSATLPYPAEDLIWMLFRRS
jgi:SAM-dependent methyltransferase